jgi:GDPmannose 4,6-dehydratase
MTKKVLITGITGQDGAYLAEFLLDKGYEVHGLVRRTSLPKYDRIEHIKNRLILHYGDMTDAANLIDIVKKTNPHELYNLAAQSDVAISFDTAEYTANTDALGTLRLLEAIRILDLTKHTKFYQASSSELFGNAHAPQNEDTPFAPCSPYACAKAYAYFITQTYRNAYGVHASNGILFNHESPLRGEEFVTQKICKGVAAIHKDQQEMLTLGNLDAKRDWGHARDYVRGMWMMVQQDKPDDYVLATGQSHSVREFVTHAFDHIGVTIEWRGNGADEVGVNAQTGQTLVKIDPHFFRPIDVHHLEGDASKAREKLGWTPEISFHDFVTEMMREALK